MVQGDKPLLHIRTGTHLLRRTKQNTDLTGTDFTEQFLLLRFGVCIMDKGNLFLRNALGNEFLFQIVINILEVAHHCHAVLHFHINGFRRRR